MLAVLLHRSTKKLEETHRIVAETEEVGISVLDTMAQQRETLLGTHEKVSSRRLSFALLSSERVESLCYIVDTLIVMFRSARRGQ